MTFTDCCEAILRCPRANVYAKAYAEAGRGMRGDAAKVQALYLLNNITGWRGETAKLVRPVLKMIGGVK